MSLRTSITQIQNSIIDLYLSLEQRFKENKLISELWISMAHDVSRQVASLNALPKSFWYRLKSEHKDLQETIDGIRRPQLSEKSNDLSLGRCLETAIISEEATILKAYGPIIRNLRKNWTERALDFYITVKAHLARIKSVTEAFSGDPLTIQRASLMLQSFEKETQGPQTEGMARVKKPPAGRTVSERKAKKKPLPKPSQHPFPLVKRSKTHPGQSKHYIEKVSIRRKRASR